VRDKGTRETKARGTYTHILGEQQSVLEDIGKHHTKTLGPFQQSRGPITTQKGAQSQKVLRKRED
jgi:hypothetical protein